ncbi:ubiquitin carboxyl-terminal hydrolase 12A-like [Oratosquilla oratoria]|uniref:ubiquitin carboxyl-terminal hydrolase 12A-like n=1 Tax=Oratosquilla oratoria TaxID=337810 RepID=UPI003F775621
MTALDRTQQQQGSGGPPPPLPAAAAQGQGGGGGGGGGKCRLSLRGQKRSLSSDISPAPEPRSSQRIRTSSTGEQMPDDRNKTPAGIRKSGGNSSSSSSSSSGKATPPLIQTKRGNASSHVSEPGTRLTGVRALANLGNTCFLNSVLYALRFLPGFTHDLHHLHTHLQRCKIDNDSALGRRVQFLAELHHVFVSLGRDERDPGEKGSPAFQPLSFLEALRVVNPQFEGNRQQDAHELLNCLLDQLCHLPQDLQGLATATSTQPLWPEDENGPPEVKKRRRSERIQAIEEDSSKAVDLVGSKFKGEMCLETRCLECEHTTTRQETFIDVCVPVKTKADFDDEDMSEPEVFMSALCEEELVRDTNKYWCDGCRHHNEARRSVHFPTLPLHLIVHMKRFSAYQRNTFMSKCSDAMPAPLELSCFCRSCLHQGPGRQQPPRHPIYRLSAVVCHLGSAITSGHYLSFVRLREDKGATNCGRDNNGQGSTCAWSGCCAHTTMPFGNTFGTGGSPTEGPSAGQEGGEGGKNSSGNNSNSLWLECDDDKLKVVTAGEVVNVMRTTLITPYLLFYSQL